MVFDYFSSKKLKDKKDGPRSPVRSPVLNEEDERFLQRITSEGTPPPLPPRPTVIADDGQAREVADAPAPSTADAAQVTLPASPSTEGAEATATEADPKKKRFWHYMPGMGSKGKGKASDEKVQDGTSDTAKISQTAPIQPESSDVNDPQKGEEDLTAVLDQLNLAAVNNRVFSFSKESQELLERFKQVLKDLVNGVPTAYDDLEKLLTNSEGQLQKMYKSMPPFIQTLIKSLPAKMTATLAPELMAAASEKPRADAAAMHAAGEKREESKDKKKQKKSRIPSLKRLVTEEGAVAGMLRSILNFLKMRFPAVMTGTNVLMSLAVFILLFVFWYCHKRGRETRLERERSAANASSTSVSEIDESLVLEHDLEGEEKRVPGLEVESPIHIHVDPTVGDKPSATVADMPSVLNLPEPFSVPLPKSPGTPAGSSKG